MFVDDYTVVNCSIIVVLCQINISNCQQVQTYPHFPGISYYLAHWGSKYFGASLKYLDWESKVVGPHVSSLTLEGVQILQHYPEI